MDSQCNDVNSTVYDPEFLPGNISFQAIDATNVNIPFNTGNIMLPSPEYCSRELHACMPSSNPQQPIPTQQGTASMFYQTQTPINPIKLEPSIYQKLECYSRNHEELDMVVIPGGMETTQKPHCTSVNQSYVSCPPTPTTPHNGFEGFPTPPAEINVGPMLNPAFVALYRQQEMFYEQGCYFLHVAKPRNPHLAFVSFATAANLGSQRGKHQYAYCFQHGIGVNKDETKAVSIYLEIASVDPPNAATLCQLGICFQNGIGVEVDAPRAVQYYERAVLMGHKDAMFNLAYCLRYGLGTPVDYERAYELYYRLAELGDPQGMKLLGNCKAAGIGTVKDENGAVELFRRSSESDIYWGGKIQYALCLLKGMNVVPNHIEAFKLVRTVCEDFPLCPGPNKLLLGRLYHFGTGCPVDLEKALYWYERALRSYHMLPCFVQECEMLIDDIRNQQYQNSIMFDVNIYRED